MNKGLSNVHNVYLGGRLVKRMYRQDAIVYEGFPVNDLLAFYRFNGNILDSVGTIAPLATGTNASINFTSGLNGTSAIRFNSFGTCSNGAGLMCPQNVWNLYSGNTKASYSFWFKFTQNIPNENPINSGCGMAFFGNDFGTFGFGVGPTDGVNTGRPRVYIAGQGPPIYTFASPIVVGQWYHLAGTYDNTTRNFRVYVNGSLVHNHTFPSAISAPPQNFLGFGINQIGGYFNAGTNRGGEYGIPIIMESVGLWTKVLNASEVAAIYNDGNGKDLP